MSIEFVCISHEQAKQFQSLHGLTEPILRGGADGRLTLLDPSPVRKALWQAIKAQHGLPEQGRYKVNTDPTSDKYCIICDKYTGIPLGRAKSGMPYGAIPLATLTPFLNTQWDAQVPLPAAALHIGAGIFIHEEKLYFPAL